MSLKIQNDLNSLIEELGNLLNVIPQDSWNETILGVFFIDNSISIQVYSYLEEEKSFVNIFDKYSSNIIFEEDIKELKRISIEIYEMCKSIGDDFNILSFYLNIHGEFNIDFEYDIKTKDINKVINNWLKYNIE